MYWKFLAILPLVWVISSATPSRGQPTPLAQHYLALQKQADCQSMISLAERTTEDVRKATQNPAWQHAYMMWQIPEDCASYLTPANRQMQREVAEVLEEQKQQARQSRCVQAKTAFEEAVQEAAKPEEFQDQYDVFYRGNSAAVVRQRLELFVSSACTPDEQDALRRRIDEVVTAKDLQVKAAIAKVEVAEQTQRAIAKRPTQKSTASRSAAAQRSGMEGQATEIRTTGPATLQPAIQQTRSASRGLRCCDGTQSQSCSCSGSHRGCCSHHGGVCGCQ